MGVVKQQFEYTRFFLEGEESQERDTRADDVLPETSANNLVPRVLSLGVERGPGNEVDQRPLCC